MSSHPSTRAGWPARRLLLTLTLGCLAGSSMASAVEDEAGLLEAQLIALEIAGGLRPSEDLTQTILEDLALIRETYPETSDIHFRARWVASELLIKLSAEGLAKLESGEFEGLDALNELYGAASIDPLLLDRWFRLTFDDVLNPEILSEPYVALPEIEFAEPNFTVGDGSTIDAEPPVYTFRRRSGDCYAGCIHESAWTLIVEDGMVSTVGDPPAWAVAEPDGILLGLASLLTLAAMAGLSGLSSGSLTAGELLQP